VRFYRSPRHLQLAGDFSIVTALQEQLYDLLFARSQPDGLLCHSLLSSFDHCDSYLR